MSTPTPTIAMDGFEDRPTLVKLREIANNLWWSWHPRAQALFRAVDPAGWAAHHENPVALLRGLEPHRLKALEADGDFMGTLEQVHESFLDYLAEDPQEYFASEHAPIAYFCMEYGLHESMALYAGGLGILAGDHLKAASDAGIPFVAVGIFFRGGYFSQVLDQSGEQEAVYAIADARDQPMVALTDGRGSELRVSVDLGPRRVRLRVWRVTVGRSVLFLLDADVPENSSEDRRITERLYAVGDTLRIEQQILLGVGGVRLLEGPLALRPRVYHLNEGHCAFLTLERAGRKMEQGLGFSEALAAVVSSTVFTTHTPVPEGNQVFSVALVAQYWQKWCERRGVDWGDFLALGTDGNEQNSGLFSMTVLALKSSARANGVAQLHGRIARAMWKGLYPGRSVEEVPIGAITNGIHLGTWLGPEIRALLEESAALRLDHKHIQSPAWAAAETLPPARIWEAHRAQRSRLFEELELRVRAQDRRRGENGATKALEHFDPEALTIGFARRFAVYKRAAMLFEEPDPLARILGDPSRPVQLIFSGKAHPADKAGQDLIKTIFRASRHPAFLGRVFFLEDYDMRLGKKLTQGVDLWLNTPLRPHEASGTSGMKAAVNGVLNCSIMDGWWDEAFSSEIGWRIPSCDDAPSPGERDRSEARAFLELLEDEVKPRFYARDEAGVPRDWVRMMAASIAWVGPRFSALRMIKDYEREVYL